MGSVAALASPAVPRLARPLPRHVRPFPDETLSSYLRRVEYANQLTGGARVPQLLGVLGHVAG